MPRTDKQQVFRNGVLQSEQTATVDDATIFREDAPKRLRQSYAALRQWALDAETATAAWDAATQGQKNATMKVVITRFGRLCDGLADILMHQALDT